MQSERKFLMKMHELEKTNPDKVHAFILQRQNWKLKSQQRLTKTTRHELRKEWDHNRYLERKYYNELEQPFKTKNRHKYMKKYYHENFDQINKTKLIYDRKYPERLKAKLYILILYKNGLTVDFCGICGSDVRVEAHHENYDLPNSIIWLCKKCHRCLHSGKIPNA